MKRRACLFALALGSALLAGCSQRFDLQPDSPLPSGCYADCPVRSPEAQNDSLPVWNPSR